MNSVTSEALIADARSAFDYYLVATRGLCRSRPRPDGTFLYPEETIQADSGAFAGVFNCVYSTSLIPQRQGHFRSSAAS